LKSRKANAAEVELRLGAAHNYQVSLASIGNVYLLRRDYFTAISYYQRALARDNKDRVAVKKWTRNINLDYARIRLEVDQQTSRVA
jgi:tetratricopeptide (TPR) repeat protein